MIKTINIKFDGKYVFQVSVSGSDDLVKKLTENVWFQNGLTNGVEALIKDKVSRKIKEDNLQTVSSITKENK